MEDFTNFLLNVIDTVATPSEAVSEIRDILLKPTDRDRKYYVAPLEVCILFGDVYMFERILDIAHRESNDPDIDRELMSGIVGVSDEDQWFGKIKHTLKSRDLTEWEMTLVRVLENPPNDMPDTMLDYLLDNPVKIGERYQCQKQLIIAILLNDFGMFRVILDHLSANPCELTRCQNAILARAVVAGDQDMVNELCDSVCA